MQVVPVSDVYNQALNATLGGQSVTINIYQKSTGLFMDVLINNAVVIAGVICQDRNRIVRDAYLGFIGDLIWVDQQGTGDPSSPGLGSRYLLYYLEAADL